jgi:hypothetical protein
MTDEEWERQPEEDQRDEFYRLSATKLPCQNCGVEGCIFNTLMSNTFSNWFRVECYEGEIKGRKPAGCNRTTEKYRGHSGLIQAIADWNEGKTRELR